jgi:hypothetical protein
MDRLEQYRDIVSRVIQQYAGFKSNGRDIEDQVIMDRVNDHYLVMNVGWDGKRRLHWCTIHLDIIDGKVWIQHDATDRPVADELLEAGIPHEDIVLGFHPASLRQYTDFAVG